MEPVAEKEFGIRLEKDIGTVLFRAVAVHVGNKPSFLERSLVHLSVAHAADGETAAQRIDGLEAHSVQSHAGGVHVVVILSASIELRDGGDQRLQGDAASVIADRSRKVFPYLNLYTLAVTLVEFVDTVVDGLLQKHIDAVFGMGSVAQPSDVHTGADADVLHVIEMADVVFRIFAGRTDSCRISHFFFHIHPFILSLSCSSGGACAVPS